MNNLKIDIHQNLKEIITDKIEHTQRSINELNISKAQETKSSAGDKFETTREMMQMEEDKAQLRLLNYIELRNILSQIDPKVHHTSAISGSLIATSTLSYFLGIGMGKIEIKNQVIYCISIDAPIGQLLLGKQKGDIFTFNGQSIEILSIK